MWVSVPTGFTVFIQYLKLAAIGHFLTRLDTKDMNALPSPRQNHLLAALPTSTFDRLLPDLELVPFALGQIIYESGGPQGYVFFPSTGIVSLLSVMQDTASAEIAIVGND